MAHANTIAIMDAHCTWRACDDVPEISAWHARDTVALWEALGDSPQDAVPYFAIPWPSARVVARAILDGALDVRGTLADVGCGSGIVACAAALRGAKAIAVDVDARACELAVELARRHRVTVEARVGDAAEADVIVCADLVSREAQVAPFARAVREWRERGARVILADSGRPFFDAHGAELLLQREVRADDVVDSGGARVVRVYT